jgi:hypothetical protein
VESNPNPVPTASHSNSYCHLIGEDGGEAENDYEFKLSDNSDEDFVLEYPTNDASDSAANDEVLPLWARIGHKTSNDAGYRNNRIICQWVLAGDPHPFHFLPDSEVAWYKLSDAEQLVQVEKVQKAFPVSPLQNPALCSELIRSIQFQQEKARQGLREKGMKRRASGNYRGASGKRGKK